MKHDVCEERQVRGQNGELLTIERCDDAGLTPSTPRVTVRQGDGNRRSESHRTSRTRTQHLRFLGAWVTALSLMGCPDIPKTAVSDTFGQDAGSDADVFIPLEFHRLLPSVGDPEGGLRVSVFGAGFTKGAQVFFGDALADGVLVMDSTRLNCNVPASEPGLVDVKVVLLDGQEALLERAYLTRGPFLIHSVTPQAGRSRGELTLRVQGEFFDSETRIFVGGRTLKNPKLLDDTTIEGGLPARLQGRSGWVDIVATNGFEQRVLRQAFRMSDDLEVGWITPPSGLTGGGTFVTLYGSGLDPEAHVSIGGKATELLIAGEGSSLTVRVPPLPAGDHEVEVTNGQESLLLPGAFHVRHEVAASEGLSLLHGWPRVAEPSGGTTLALAIQGLPLSGAAQGLKIMIGALPATIIDVNAAESLVVIEAPPGPVGAATITVTRPGETSLRADLLSYETALVIGQVQPSEGAVVPEGVVVIEGSGFGPATEVFFGNALGEVTGIADDGQMLTVKPPPGVPGLVDIQIRSAGRQSLAKASYEYVTGDDPRLWALLSPDGGQAGGRVLRLFGDGFRSLSGDLRVGTTVVDSYEVLDDATLTFRAPRSEIGAFSVEVGAAGRLAMAYEAFDPTSSYGGASGGTIPEALNVTVLEMSTRKPVAEAFVILWDDLGTPYQGLTDDRGQITFSDLFFGAPQMVTAGKDMHTTSSVVDFDARNVTLLLYSFEPAPPGRGTPDPPTPIPGGSVSGVVSGLDKYIILPPGDCDSLGNALPGMLCAPCSNDLDCLDDGAHCLDLGEQGKRCGAGCETDADCSPDYVCTGMGFGKIQCVPRPGKKTAFCAVTQPDVFSYESSPPSGEAEEEVPSSSPLGPGVFTDEAAVYDMETSPGAKSVVCFGGYMGVNPETGESSFVPLRMGVRRHVFVEPGQSIGAQDVVLDIPLDRTLRIRLDGAPTEPGEADRHQVDVFLDFGGDGVFRMPERGFGIGINDFSLRHFPTKFEDSLYDVTTSVLARAIPETTAQGESNDAAFVHMRDLGAVNRDSIFSVLPGGVAETQYGIATDIYGMSGTGDRLWAAGSGGQVLVFDGTWWGLKQTPTKARLTAVFARDPANIVAVGDEGTFLHSDGLVWSTVPVPEELRQVNWWAVAGVGSTWWLSGDEGLWVTDGDAFVQILGQEGERPQHVRAIWSGNADSAWIAGEGGLLRRWNGTTFESFDAPGADLLGLGGLSDTDVWVVGERGRILHYDGTAFFEYQALTSQTLHAVTIVGPDEVWAVGEGGTVLKWDGQRWTLQPGVEHIDLHGVGRTNQGALMVGGLPVLIAGPFLPIPKPVNPNGLGQFMGSPISWSVGEGAIPSLTLVGLTEGGGFPFWWLFVNGARRQVPLPDLAAAWGLTPIWPGSGFLRLTSFYVPDLSIDDFDYTSLSQSSWRAWSVADFPVNW